LSEIVFRRVVLGLALLAVIVVAQGCGGGNRTTSSAAQRASRAVSPGGDGTTDKPARIIVPKPTAITLARARRLGFVPATAQFRAFCEHVAHLTGWTVFCPPIIPRGPLYAQSGLPYETRRLDSAAFGMPNLSGARARYFRPAWAASFVSRSVKAGPDLIGHWMIAEGSPAALSRFTRPVESLSAAVVTSIRLDGRAAKLYVLPNRGFGSMYSGHIMVQWNVGREIIQVSFHGHTTKQRQRTLVFAAALGG
jgi:hypothetical protein